MTLLLKNPHSILAALRERPADVLEIALPRAREHAVWSAIAQLAAERRIPLVAALDAPDDAQNFSRAGGTRDPRGGRGVRGQAGVAHGEKSGRQTAAGARVQPRAAVELDQLFNSKLMPPEKSAGESSRGETHGNGINPICLALDCIQDPQNVGAIFRSAAFFGAGGIVLTADRSAPLNAAVYDVAAGGVEYVPHSLQINLARALEQAKAAGLWILGTDERAETDLREIRSDRPWLVVLGNEERGLRRLTRENCDQLCRIAPAVNIPSLNVSVAAGILLAQLQCGYFR